MVARLRQRGFVFQVILLTQDKPRLLDDTRRKRSWHSEELALHTQVLPGVDPRFEHWGLKEGAQPTVLHGWAKSPASGKEEVSRLHRNPHHEFGVRPGWPVPG